MKYTIKLSVLSKSNINAFDSRLDSKGKAIEPKYVTKPSYAHGFDYVTDKPFTAREILDEIIASKKIQYVIASEVRIKKVKVEDTATIDKDHFELVITIQEPE